MIYVIMYGIAVVGLGITGVVLVMAGWLWYKHQWYAFVDWLDEAGDRGLLWAADMLFGEQVE